MHHARNAGKAVAIVTLALVALGCGASNDPDETGRADDVEQPAGALDDEGADAELDSVTDDDTRIDVDDLDDAELLEATDAMSDAEYDAFLDGLDDEQFNRLTDLYDDPEQGEDTVDAAQQADTDDPDEVETPEEPETPEVTDASVAPPAGGGISGGTRDDVECSAEGLGTDPRTTFTTAHPVVEGLLGDVCFGEVDDRLVAAWNSLATIVPQGQLGDLGLFGGYEAGDEWDGSLAFVNALDTDGTLFQMSVNLTEYEADPIEAQVTMAHEFSHVFTSIPSQLDRTDEAFDSCTTYNNGEGCFLPTSIMFQWVTEFWGNGLIDQIDPNAEPSTSDGEARCAADAGFFGSYAASNPEEDFAESFSAYVFGIESSAPEQEARLDWIANQPGLVEYRDRVVAAGIETPPNNFGECGLG